MTTTQESVRAEQAVVTDRPRFDWRTDTSPFSTLSGRQPARIQLRQVGDDDFELLDSFRFSSPDGRTRIPVTAETLGSTDLASIPSFLGWFARRHGRHTPAALLHDQLITEDPGRLPPEQRLAPADADRLFRVALRASEVALVKSWMLWTGVTLLTRWRRTPWSRVGIVGWFVAALAGTALLLWGAATGNLGLVAVALVAPVPFAGLWGRQYVAGMIAGYSFWWVAFGSGPGWLAYQLYRAIEVVARALGRLRPPDKRTPLPPPPPFDQR
jgi:Protein of unknown function (DUF1353)